MKGWRRSFRAARGRLGENIILLAPSAADASVSSFRQSVELEKLKEENRRLKMQCSELEASVADLRAPEGGTNSDVGRVLKCGCCGRFGRGGDSAESQ